MNRRNLSIGDKAFDVGIYIISGLIALLCLYPLYLVLINSFSDPFAVAKGEVVIIPKGFSFDAYKEAFKNGDIVRGYANSLFYLFFGVIINMVMTIPAAYALSKQHMKGRNAIMMMIVFTMYFSGGLIPTYLVVKNLGMTNTIWSMIIPGLISTYNLLLIKSYFESMPAGLLDAALIDGCSPMRTLIQIVLPLSLPVLMSVTLFYMVGYWNTYYAYVIYCYDMDLRPLQVVLRDIISKATGETEAEGYIPTITVQMSAIVFACIPIICVYPFIQKYFTKGVMLGAIKG